MVVVVGSGFVGSALRRALASRGLRHHVLSRSEVDYADPGELGRWLDSRPVRVMVNAAGWNGMTVDDVERDPRRGHGPNVELPERLAKACHERAIRFAQISSGCVFHGPGPFGEGDEPNFLVTAYGRQKREAELRVLAVGDAWIFRIRLPLSAVDHPRNLLTKLGRYGRILGGRQSVTWLEDFCIRWLSVVEGARPGIYHAVQRGLLDIETAARTMGNGAPLWDAGEFARAGHVARSECELCPDKYEACSGGGLASAQDALSWCARQMACVGHKE